MFVTLIMTKERQDDLVPTGSFATVIDLTDEPEKAVFVNRLTGCGNAFWRTLERRDETETR